MKSVSIQERSSYFKRVDNAEMAALLQGRLSDTSDKSALKILEEQAAFGLGEIWSSLLGETLAVHCLPVKIKNQQLVIRCDHGIFAQQIQLLQPQILEKINQSQKVALPITSIKTQVAALNFAKPAFPQTGIAAENSTKSASGLKVQDIMSPNDKLDIRRDPERHLRFQKLIDAMKGSQAPPNEAQD